MVQSVQPFARWLRPVSSSLSDPGAVLLPGLSACLWLRPPSLGTGPALLETRLAGQGSRTGTWVVVVSGDTSRRNETLV